MRKHGPSKGNPSMGAQNTLEGKIGDFWLKLSFIMETVRDMQMVTMEH